MKLFGCFLIKAQLLGREGCGYPDAKLVSFFCFANFDCGNFSVIIKF